MDNSKFQTLLSERQKLMAEFVELKTVLLHKICEMNEYNKQAKIFLDKSHRTLETKVIIFSS